MSYDVNDFEIEVIERSRTLPVVADFWAEWCAPCRMLGPVLEKLEAESEGAWMLAKVDTESMPEAAMRYGVRSIPAVKLFVNGAVSAEFVGAQPEHVIRQWLSTNAPPQRAKIVDEAGLMLPRGDVTRGRKLLSQVLDEDATDERARVMLAQSLALESPSEAAALVEPIEAGSSFDDVAEALRNYASLLAVDAAALPDGRARDLFASALDAIRGGDFDAALGSLIEVIRLDRWYNDDAARKACLALFKALGEGHEVTLRHRKEFNRALY